MYRLETPLSQSTDPGHEAREEKERESVVKLYGVTKVQGHGLDKGEECISFKPDMERNPQKYMKGWQANIKPKM